MTAAADPHAVQTSLLGHRSFAFYWCARTFTNGAYMMQAVAAGWQIYALTGSAFDLGLVGLVQFFPVVVLGLLVAILFVVGGISAFFIRDIVKRLASLKGKSA